MRHPTLVLLVLALACNTDDDTKEGGAGDADTDGPVDADGDGYGGDADCDDSSAAIAPGADELCDGLDNDCDGDIDEDPVDGDTFYVDADGDGHGDAAAAVLACALESGLSASGDDCDDTDPAVSPSATEVCDDADTDEDCDGSADDADDSVDPDSLGAWFADTDADGHGAGEAAAACDDPSADGALFSATGDDCDDTNAAIHPDATEVCDDQDTDEDCDGSADDADDSVDEASLATWYGDADLDGFGATATTTLACDDPSTETASWTADATDCDDTRADINPDGQEVCDADDADEDCDTLSDDLDTSVDAGTFTPWYVDADGDGYGNPTGSQLACDAPASGGRSFVSDGTDCDDSDGAISPAGTEVCDADDADEDCDGLADDADTSVDALTMTTWFADADEDGHGDAASTQDACDDPSTSGDTWLATADDCDDTRGDVSPSGAEVCDADDTDEDCDGSADDADASVDATTMSTWYADADEDAYGDAASTQDACDDPSATGSLYVADATDCDDTDSAISPAATEVCDADDTDEDCDGLADDADASVDATTMSTWYADADADGHGDSADAGTAACDDPSGAGGSYAATDDDCDDGDGAVSPSSAEICDPDDTDEDCDGLADDADPGVDATSLLDWSIDADGDGFGDAGGTAITQCADPSTAGTTYVDDATDCDDLDADISPGAAEVCDAADVDEDCDGLSDDADGSLDATSASDWYPDDDLDGYGDGTATPVPACDDPSGATTTYVDDDADCDDSDPDINPGATEVYGDGTDQTCDGEDAPQFACSGYTVPGSYATINAASSALGNSATVQTICLTARTYTENPTIRGNLEIIGPSQYDTTINGRVTFASGRSGSTIGVQGVTVTNGIYVEDGASTFTTTLTDCILEDSPNHNIHIERNGSGTPHMNVRRCIIEARSSSSAIYLYDYGYNSTDRVRLEVRDNYISGGSYTLRTAVTKSSSRRTYQTVIIANNTVEGGNYGLWMIGRFTNFQIKNNILTANTRAFHWDGGGSMVNDYNLYYGNSTNFSGSATGGSNRITSDPGLSADSPPVPTSGGVADGAGTTSYASTQDYWTNTRPSPPSIGAVEPQ